jgi:hypothetical protein
MFFGEFLVMKKVINEDQLLDALTYQIEHLPSFLRVIREEKILPTSELFRMVKVQLETNSDLIGVLRDENKIDEKQLHNIFAKQASNRKMLGEVLIELKMTDQSTVENMLYDFLRDKDNLKKIKQVETAKEVTEFPKEIEMSEAALESLRELGMVIDTPATAKSAPVKTSSEPVEANIFVEEFLNVYNNKMKNKLAKLLDILKQSEQDDSDISNYFNSLYRELHVLKGAAQVGDLKVTENFLAAWEKVIETLMTKKVPEIKSWCSAGLPALEEGLTHLWSMREAVANDKTEVNIQSIAELLDVVKSLE